MSEQHPNGKSSQKPSGINNNKKQPNRSGSSKRPAPSSDATMPRTPAPGPQSGSGYSRQQAYERQRPKDPTGQKRSTVPCAPENSALADELRSRLRGKPTRAAHNRHWYIEVLHAALDVLL